MDASHVQYSTNNATDDLVKRPRRGLGDGSEISFPLYFNEGMSNWHSMRKIESTGRRFVEILESLSCLRDF